MSEEENNDLETQFKLAEIGAEIITDDNEPEIEISSEEAEKIRKAKLIEEFADETPQKLRTLPQRKPENAKIPDNGKLGEKFTIKLGKKFGTVNLQVYQGEKIILDAGNSNIIHDKDDKNVDEVSYNFYDPTPLRGKEINSLTAGKYLIKIHAYGSEFGDELEQEQIIDIK